MSIHQLTRERFHMIPETRKALQPGQIIQGNILKLYPNNRALIQLGMQQMVAQLEAPLSVGERYHLQVQSSGELIHLRVLGDRLISEEHANLSKLIDSLGIKANRAESNFIQTLINEKIPFNKEHLVNSFRLMDQFGKSSEAQQVIKQMITSKLPLTSPVFNALYTKSTNKLSEIMQDLLSELRRADTTTPLKQKLAKQLGQLAERPVHSRNVFSQQIMGQSLNNQQQLFTMLQNIGMISKQTDYSTWISKMQAYVNQTNSETTSYSTTPPLFQMNETDNRQVMEQLIKNQVILRNESSLLLQNREKSIQQSSTKDGSITSPSFARLQQNITENILLHLNEKHRQHVQSLLNNSVDINKMLTLLQTFSNEELFANVNQVLTNIHTEEVFLASSVREQFLSQIRNVLLLSGLSYEHSLLYDTTQGEQINSIKSALIQLVQGDPSVNDRAQQLLHLINGLQIQSVNETSNFIQASLLIPGERLNLNSDLYLDFESKKTDNGEINPDYCRILFYLDLTYLKETIIDMNIQKRLVTVTVFNDSEGSGDYSSRFQQTLKESLLSLDYNLITLSFKGLQQLHVKNEDSIPRQSRKDQNSYEGFDYRV